MLSDISLRQIIEGEVCVVPMLFLDIICVLFAMDKNPGCGLPGLDTGIPITNYVILDKLPNF